MGILVAVVAVVVGVPVVGVAALALYRGSRRRAKFNPATDPGARFVDDADRALLDRLIAAAPGDGVTGQGDAAAACARGEAALEAWQGDEESLEAAGKAFGEALAADPKLAKAWVGLGEACMDACYSHSDSFAEVYWRGGLEKAERFADRALELDPKSDDAIALKASYRRRRGYVDEAEKLLEAANPNHWRVAWVKAGLLSDRDRYDLWVKELAKATGVAPRARQSTLFNALGLAFTKTLEFDKAVESFDKAVTLAPKYAWAWHNRALALMRAGKKEEALESSNKALALGEFTAARELNDRLKRG